MSTNNYRPHIHIVPEDRADEEIANGFVNSLAEVLSPYREGSCLVGIQYRGASAQAHMTLGEEWRVHPTDELLHRLRELAGDEQVKVVY